MWTEIIIVSIATLVLGVFGTLWWWRLADAWVPEKHRRFHDKQAESDPSKVVVIKSEDPGP